MKKMQQCCWCGEEMGVYDAPYNHTDTCGKLECNHEARAMDRQYREEAHHDLDQQMGWD